ncbi:unnamed protein product [Ilex paraguariensis]|uniref:Uncharacterized protein n=1 Tax=Ilex paraguariensis TaxID=185542 RepID=A0ABC8QWB4_9AQUA
MSNSLTDQLFDLELALTMVDDSAGVIQISDLSSSHRNDMPTMTASGFCREGDESFDLDQALTMVDDSTSVVEISDSSAPHRNDIQTSAWKASDQATVANKFHVATYIMKFVSPSGFLSTILALCAGSNFSVSGDRKNIR